MESPRLYLFYDPACPLCRRFKSLVGSWDRHGRIKAVGLDPENLARHFPDFDIQAAQRQLTVCDAAGVCRRGEEALKRLAEELPGLSRLGWVWRLPGTGTALRRAYRAADNRRAECRQCSGGWRPGRRHR